MTTTTHASPRRRARTLAVALSVLLVGTALYARNVRAEAPSSGSHPALLSHPRDSLGISTLATTAVRASAGEIAVADPRVGLAPVAIAWTSRWGRI